MGYIGQRVRIPVGRGGLLTDQNQSDIPPTNLIEATNIEIRNGIVQKELGSRKFNNTALSGTSGIVALIDWHPNTVKQAFVAVTRDGKVWYVPDAETTTEIVPAAGDLAPVTLNPTTQTFILTGGSESSTKNRKLFIFTGNDPVQVIDGTALVRKNIANPPTDWSGTNQPTFGFIHKSFMLAFGNRNDPFRVYISLATDHENFTDSVKNFTVDPGEAQGLISANVYKGRPFLFKFPQGINSVDDSAADPASWFAPRLTDELGAASIRSAAQVLDDLFIANSTGSITSASASDKLGDIEAGDILRNLKVENFIRTQVNQAGLSDRQAIYHSERKYAFFTYRSAGGIKNDRIVKLDMSQTPAAVTITDKDQPNVIIMRQVKTVLKPFYGADDGFIYEMDREDRNVASVAYEGLFQTPHMDLGFIDPLLAEQNKVFDFLEVSFYPTGTWDLSVEVQIDGRVKETITFPLSYDPVLDDLELDSEQLHGPVARSVRKRLHGRGRRISLKCSNNGLNENFKISALTLYFRVSDENAKEPSN